MAGRDRAVECRKCGRKGLIIETERNKWHTNKAAAGQTKGRGVNRLRTVDTAGALGEEAAGGGALPYRTINPI